MRNMRVKVLYLGLVRAKTGRESEEYELAEGASLHDLLDELSSKYRGGLGDLLRADEKTRLDPTIVATVNGASKDISQARKIKLKEGDTVALMSLISGG
ncbi:MAG: molybdenum cofactor biosynthesis protein D [Candidatus Bathyarchaeota archaeon B63]|nr:MAG: molybdenum cofactor biosynthesis protein D [Candidatus Bathyarchaeota archaeon B63]